MCACKCRQLAHKFMSPQLQTLLEQLGVVKRKRSKGDKERPPAPSSARAGWREGTLAGDEADVQWGGTGVDGLPPGADMGAQEALLARMFKPHKASALGGPQSHPACRGRVGCAWDRTCTVHCLQVKKLVEHQRAAYQAAVDLRRSGGVSGKYGAEAKMHKQVCFIFPLA